MHVYAQKVYQDKLIRFAVWAQRDVYPGYFEGDASEQTQEKNEAAKAKLEATGNAFTIPVTRIKETVPHLLTGMVYGWKFDYTPADKARAVKEYFYHEPVQALSGEEISKIRYVKPWVEDDRLLCWVEYNRTDIQERAFLSWQSITHPRIKGVGYARLSDGFEGIQQACDEALKNAIREYERKIIKNKPKEITGTVIIATPPMIGIDAGKYMVTLDFFMETDRIITYQTF
ncbi:MAG: hypothetical protein K6G80_01220 [Treponema sp.]|nr:hypothetical protein [Treponema sp.]